jgi:hypothetical protein
MGQTRTIARPALRLPQFTSDQSGGGPAAMTTPTQPPQPTTPCPPSPATPHLYAPPPAPPTTNPPNPVKSQNPPTQPHMPCSIPSLTNLLQPTPHIRAFRPALSSSPSRYRPRSCVSSDSCSFVLEFAGVSAPLLACTCTPVLA